MTVPANPQNASVNRMAKRDKTPEIEAMYRDVRFHFMRVDIWVEDFGIANKLDARSIAMVRERLDEAILWLNRAVALLGEPISEDQ